MAERVQKILAHWGIASRRSAEKMILAGRVTLNGAPVQLGDRADPVIDKLCVDGKQVQPNQRPKHHYYLIHKPKGVVSTCKDPRDRRTVLTLLPKELQQGQGMHPIGRLDAQSTGALLLTNDGELTLALTHPRYHVSKRYRVWLRGIVPKQPLEQWRQGVMVEGRKTQPATITLKKVDRNQTCVDIILTEGKNRQIRRIAEQLGYPVVSLHRFAIGNIKLDNLQRGHARPLTNKEIRHLQQHIHSQPSHHSPVPHREHSA